MVSKTIGRDKSEYLPDVKEAGVPRIVHVILWNDTLTFKNYLCILGIVKNLRPYIIILHTQKDFKTRQFQYDNWFEKATKEIPSLQVEQLDMVDKTSYSITNEIHDALSVLSAAGGMYVNLNTIINVDLWPQRNLTFKIGLAENSSIGFVAMSQSSNMPRKFWDGIKAGPRSNCISSERFTGSDTCCTITHDIYPVDIMLTNSSFGALARKLFYDNIDIQKPQRSFPAIPKLVHYVWFGDDDIDFTMFLSFLSTQRFVKPKKVFIYVDSDVRYSRPYFEKMKAYSNVEIIYYGSLKTVYQTNIRSASHASDIVRVDVLLRYGGIYIDWDVYWLKPLDDLLTKGYETIASLDFMKDMYPRQEFPDTVNMGVVLARPRSRFLQLWQNSFKEYTAQHDTYHAVELVYKLYEEHPDLLVIDKRLQVMCFAYKCHPLWLENYKDASIHNSFNFTQDAYAVHFTYPTPKELTSEKLIKESKGYFADIGRHILGDS